MLRKALLRALLGFPLGVFIAYTLTILISLFIATGEYSPVEPSLTASIGSQMNAVLVQYLLSGLLGMAFSAGSLVWENEAWSPLRRTLVHLVIVSAFMFPVAYLNHWMEHTPLGVASYFLIFIVLYAIIWVWQWLTWMRRVRAINARLSRK